MAWIKWQLTPTSRKIAELEIATGLDCFAVMGRVAAWFVWVDANCDESQTHITADYLDRRILDHPGFAAAMEAVGWVKIGPDGLISVVDYEDHFAQSAKRRAAGNRRVTLHRYKRNAQALGNDVPDGDGDGDGDGRDEDVPSERKRQTETETGTDVEAGLDEPTDNGALARPFRLDQARQEASPSRPSGPSDIPIRGDPARYHRAVRKLIEAGVDGQCQSGAADALRAASDPLAVVTAVLRSAENPRIRKRSAYVLTGIKRAIREGG